MLTTEMEINDFLQEYKRSRVIIETSVKAALNRALEFESKFQKPFYDFTVNEVLKMYESIHAISSRSLQNTNLTLKHAARWMLYIKGKNTNNIYESITKDLIDKCVDVNKKESLILSRRDLEDIQEQLLNWTDKCILSLLFEGVGGYMLKELTFLKWEQISLTDLKIYWKNGKTINITHNDYEMLRKGFNETELISFGETSRISKVKSLGLYKVRFNALSDNADPNDFGDVERRYRFCMRRLNLISKDLDVLLTSRGLQDSGFLYYLKEGVESSGLDFLEFIKTEECKALARRYDLYTDLYVQVVKEKFYKYFQ